MLRLAMWHIFSPTQKSICAFYQKYKDTIKRPEQFLMFYKHDTAYSFYVGALSGACRRSREYAERI